MPTTKLIDSVNAEIAKLQTVAAILNGEDNTTRTAVLDDKGHRGAYTMTASARKRISDAQKARWAKAKAPKIK